MNRLATIALLALISLSVSTAQQASSREITLQEDLRKCNKVIFDYLKEDDCKSTSCKDDGEDYLVCVNTSKSCYNIFVMKNSDNVTRCIDLCYKNVSIHFYPLRTNHKNCSKNAFDKYFNTSVEKEVKDTEKDTGKDVKDTEKAGDKEVKDAEEAANGDKKSDATNSSLLTFSALVCMLLALF